jgi:uncharacterized protein (TIGR02001 family)
MMMKQTLIASAVASAFLMTAAPVLADDMATPAPAAAPAEAPAPAASPLTFNVGVVSDYRFRGVSQTHGDPALQGGADYAFSNGFYAGTWLSTISWVKDWTGKGDIEWDLYGGYRGSFATDWSYDVGLISYLYPGHGDANPGLANPTTTEVYGSIGYKWLSAKYSRTVSTHFVGFYGGPNVDSDTRGSGYLELNGTYDLGNGWGVSAHVGHQKVENSEDALGLYNASYSDWNVGVTKDVGFGIVGLKYSDTNAKGSCSSAPLISAYCWPGSYNKSAGTWSGGKNVADGTAVLTFLKTF